MYMGPIVAGQLLVPVRGDVPPGEMRGIAALPVLLLAAPLMLPWLAVSALLAAVGLAAEAVRGRAGERGVELLRFAIAGAGVTALSAAIYLLAATALGVPPLAANLLSHACGIVVGYHVHGRWSFRDHAAPAGAATLLRFAAGSGLGLLLNSAWVWLAVDVAGLPAWAPVPAMLVVTPLASFALNRGWVFARR